VPAEKETKTFVARVQVGDRIQIPEPVKVVMNIKEGDYVQVTISKIEPAKEKREGEGSGA
jgi:bifunctional DNA-binding transcriptional regulator/antitoxin component of YhaV-PrlF toxin-antitoxin module